jgi:hypothetical protein
MYMGRPKGSKNKKPARGRPRGSKSKVIKVVKKRGRPAKVGKLVKKTGKRGRPKGSKNKKGYTEYPTHNSHDKMFVVPPDYKEPKSLKFLGYCECGFMISENDKVSSMIFLCPSCSKRARISKLGQAVEKERPKSKREYLEETVFSTKFTEIEAPAAEDIEEVPEIEEVLDEEKKSKDEDDVIK